MLYYPNKENALEWLARRVKDRCASSTCLPVAVGSLRASSKLVMPLSPMWRLIRILGGEDSVATKKRQAQSRKP